MKYLISFLIATVVYFIIGSILPKTIGFALGQYFYIGLPITIFITHKLINKNK